MKYLKTFEHIYFNPEQQVGKIFVVPWQTAEPYFDIHIIIDYSNEVFTCFSMTYANDEIRSPHFSDTGNKKHSEAYI